MNNPADLHVLSRARYDAAIFDLDGVITRTARVHARAWKAMFDAFLAARGAAPFDIERDYRAHVDGKPRLDGVKSFLEAHRIDLPRGTPDDAPDAQTVWGLARRKNALFLEALARDGAEVFPSSIELVHALRAAGFRTAIVSSSRNCAGILASVGATALFDAMVDENVALARSIPGKPAPDMFLAAAHALGVEPARAAVFEDALAGVEAGRRGAFGLVVGVDRAGQADALREHGADVVVADLQEMKVQEPTQRPVPRPPSALERMSEIEARTAGLRPAVFLDYDGTLSPIVERPEEAQLSDSMRAKIAHLAARCPVAVVSGRDLVDVRRRVGLAQLIYAGSHGFDIAGPNDLRQVLPEAERAVPALDAAERDLRAALDPIAGAQVERKRYSIAAHYRRVQAADAPAVERAVDAARHAHAGLRKRGGKKVFELQPDVAWDKGAAVLWLLRTLGLDADTALPLYVGDDLTDEDAFRVLAQRGVGIVVLDEPRETAATYALRDPDEVGDFLDALAAALDHERRDRGGASRS
jgi:trehalose-phosphatase